MTVCAVVSRCGFADCLTNGNHGNHGTNGADGTEGEKPDDSVFGELATSNENVATRRADKE